jgi:hypothetical protein
LDQFVDVEVRVASDASRGSDGESERFRIDPKPRVRDFDDHGTLTTLGLDDLER